MILEILGSCLIKKQLIQEPEIQILTEISSKESFTHWLCYLIQLIQVENLIAANTEIFTKARNIVRMKRFEYFDDSEVLSLCNFLIGHFNSYDALSEHRKKEMYEEWLQDETSSRGIPKWFAGVGDKILLDLIAFDFENISNLLNLKTDFRGEMDATSCLSTVSWVIHKYPKLLMSHEQVMVEDSFDSPLLQLESGVYFIQSSSSMISNFLKSDSKKLPSFFKRNSNEVLKQLEEMNVSEIKPGEQVVKKYPTM